MLDTITVSVSDLEAMVQDLKNQNVSTVRLQILEPDPEFEIPATLELTGYSPDLPYGVEFEGIESV